MQFSNAALKALAVSLFFGNSRAGDAGLRGLVPSHSAPVVECPDNIEAAIAKTSSDMDDTETMKAASNILP